ncbi:MAG: hypothetical protein VX498_09560, partial [Myxococcota bacterium]|nr:hypothetical protein [Myxococcota bacterium]
FEDGTTRVEKLGLLPGRHLVEFRALFGKLIDRAELDVPEGNAVVRARWANRQFEVYETLVLAPEPLPAEGVLVEVSPSPVVGGTLHVGPVLPLGSTETRTTTTVSMQSGHPAVLGMGVTTTETTETTTVRAAGGLGFAGVAAEVVITEPAQERLLIEEAVPLVPETRTVTFRSTDEEWTNVYLDGKKVWELRAGRPEKTITVRRGEHTLEVRDFMDNEVWCKGRLYVDGHTDLVIGIAEDSPVEVYNDSGAFVP